ncbi:putative alpha beta hydrolase fold-3 domain protein [Botrytis cinerea BcDW1]|uniref:Similar to similar to Alpha/beta hydrolase fold-3 domain protein n=2 Tax=Botryotinia fuckeliana TaxID=40559 RepID=G2XYJ9_BOTF4|nr:putative alpha beta hydrolase fold-3 domain protein [Botrytis cinerea BcDW1]CCD45536.1 similar to similar to Alpha/beta hydrolase fold-3 domain protein [Botrytis cinerea T4]
MDSAKFSQFNVSVKTYKSVRDHEIQAYILVPKNISPGPHPVIVKIHGGGSVAGSAVYAPWFPQYLLTLALRESAIIIAPNYRLLPESTAPEMISDISDFWSWMRTSSLRSSLPSNITANLSRTLLYGDSAGGHLAMLSALTEPENTIRVCIAAYPQLDIEDEWFCKKFEKHPFGAPLLPTAILDNHLEKMDKDPSKRELVSDTRDPGERLQLILVALQQGRYKEMFGEEEHVYPFRVLEKISKDGAKRKMPFLWLYHGEEDSVLPVAGTTKFARKWREAFGEEGLMVHTEEGEDHGFDTETDVDAGWVKERLEKVVGVWLS